MNLPTIELPKLDLPSLDLAALPDLGEVTGQAIGMFGSLSDLATAYMDDRIIIIMVVVYENTPPEAAAGLL